MAWKHDPIGALQEAISYVERLSLRLNLEPLVRCTAAFSDGERLFGVRYATDDKAPTCLRPRWAKVRAIASFLNREQRCFVLVEIPSGSALILSDDGVQAVHFGEQTGLIKPERSNHATAQMRYSA